MLTEVTEDLQRSVWHGDSTDGIELRYYGDWLDEVCMYIDSRCVLHLENMSDVSYWMSVYAKNHTAHVSIGSKNHKAHVLAVADGWPENNEERHNARAALAAVGKDAQLADASALLAIIERLKSRVEELERERDEALLLVEGPGTLRELANE